MRKESDVQFEWVVLKHLDAAYNLARWIVGNEQDAEDVVQDSAIRAYDSIKSLRGTDGKAWFLAIVRNVCRNCLRKRSPSINAEWPLEELSTNALNPEELLIQTWHAATVQSAIEALPIEYREVIVLRELEGMSYKEIAAVTEVPIGTVMSRLARARQRLQVTLTEESK